VGNLVAVVGNLVVVVGNLAVVVDTLAAANTLAVVVDNLVVAVVVEDTLAVAVVDIPAAVDTLAAEVLPAGIPGWGKAGTRCWPPAAEAAGTDPVPAESRAEARPTQRRFRLTAVGPRELRRRRRPQKG